VNFRFLEIPEGHQLLVGHHVELTVTLTAYVDHSERLCGSDPRGLASAAWANVSAIVLGIIRRPFNAGHEDATSVSRLRHWQSFLEPLSVRKEQKKRVRTGSPRRSFTMSPALIIPTLLSEANLVRMRCDHNRKLRPRPSSIEVFGFFTRQLTSLNDKRNQHFNGFHGSIFRQFGAEMRRATFLLNNTAVSLSIALMITSRRTSQQREDLKCS
jgi:hypothetical protein